MTLKFDRWPSKTIGHLFYTTSSFVQHFIAIGEVTLELQSGNAQSGSNSKIFRPVWPWNLTDDLEKHKGTSPKHYQAICIISLSYVNSNWSYSPETVKLGCELWDLDLWPLTLNFCKDVFFVIGNNSWKFHDDTMIGTWWKRCDGQTDGRTDRQTDWTIHRAAWSQLKKGYKTKMNKLSVKANQVQSPRVFDIFCPNWVVLTWTGDEILCRKAIGWHTHEHIWTLTQTQVTAIPKGQNYDDIIKWKHFPSYWPYVWGIHRSPVNSPHKGQWRRALIFSLICASMNGWANNHEAGDLRHHHAHYDITVMKTGPW